MEAALGLTLRTVVREATGKTGIVIERYALRAQTLAAAKREVDRGTWVQRNGITPNVFEIVDDSNTVLAHRWYKGSNLRGPWR